MQPRQVRDRSAGTVHGKKDPLAAIRFSSRTATMLDPSVHSPSQHAILLRQSQSTTLGARDALFTTDQLLRHGCHAPARRVIDSVRARGVRNETLNRRLDKLARLADRVAVIPGLDVMLADVPSVETLLSFRSTMLKARGDGGRLVVVYGTAWNNFDISFPFLHCLIARHADCFVYVKNQKGGMYATGNDELGSCIDEMSANLCHIIARLNPSRVAVMGFSGGGYAALHLAAVAGADAFLGLGIRTDFSRDSPLAKVPGRTAPCESDHQRNSLVNLRELPATATIGRLVLYYGSQDESDHEHALNMAGLPNVTIGRIERGSHQLVMDLLASGLLPGVLANALS
jgi:hypothetical protein